MSLLELPQGKKRNATKAISVSAYGLNRKKSNASMTSQKERDMFEKGDKNDERILQNARESGYKLQIDGLNTQITQLKKSNVVLQNRITSLQITESNQSSVKKKYYDSVLKMEQIRRQNDELNTKLIRQNYQ